jgi:hypothetical protein
MITRVWIVGSEVITSQGGKPRTVMEGTVWLEALTVTARLEVALVG